MIALSYFPPPAGGELKGALLVENPGYKPKTKKPYFQCINLSKIVAHLIFTLLHTGK
jgi:hypothetical protein